jgi:proteasome lid subunit RPN8/RPN11
MAAAFTLLCGLCYAGSMPVSRVTDSPVFATDDEAALAALASALERKPTVEWGGFVFQLRAGGYVFSEPVTSERREVCGYRGEAPAGSRLVAIYHTHPQHEADDYFSTRDIATASRMGVKTYIGVVSGRHIRMFDPTSMHAHPRFKYEQYGDISPGVLLQTHLPSSNDQQ